MAACKTFSKGPTCGRSPEIPGESFGWALLAEGFGSCASMLILSGPAQPAPRACAFWLRAAQAVYGWVRPMVFGSSRARMYDGSLCRPTCRRAMCALLSRMHPGDYGWGFTAGVCFVAKRAVGPV